MQRNIKRARIVAALTTVLTFGLLASFALPLPSAVKPWVCRQVR
jgi:hypothetical protein